jgi:hypothetical protein
MRLIFGVLSFFLAGLLAYHIIPAVQQVVIPYWFQGNSGGFIQAQLGPFLLEERGICILLSGLVLLVIALMVAGVYALTPRNRTDG